MNSLFRDYEIIIRSGLFDPSYYVATYADVAGRNIDPLMHYLDEGARAVRNPHPDFDAEFYLAQCRLHGHKPENPLLHYLTVGMGLGFKTKADGKEEPAVQPAPNTAKIAAAPVCELHIDTPALTNGIMETPVRGTLEISGWALARTGVAAIEIVVDDTVALEAEYGIRRRDVQAAHPHRKNALESGFVALVPRRLLRAGAHEVGVVLRDEAGETLRRDFRVLVEPLPDSDGPWALRRKMPAAELDLGRRLLARQEWRPVFHVVMPIEGEANLGAARTTLVSLRLQVYPEWRLTLRCDPELRDGAAWREHLASELAALGDRCTLAVSFAEATLPNGPAFLAALTPGCELGCDALHEMALATARYRDADFLYSDERRVNPGSGAIEAFFKPQWSPDLLLATDYVGQLWCARADLVQRVAGDAMENLFWQGNYDLVLRLTEAAAVIRHVPAVLCERAPSAPDEAEPNRLALERALRRCGVAGDVRPGLVDGTYRVKRSRIGDGLVSIIVATRATQAMIKTCIETIRTLTAYRNFEIVCVENIPAEHRSWRDWLRGNADRVVAAGEPFNWSRFNNRAAAVARGDFLLFLNDDVEIIDPDWLDVLLAHVERREVGAVGPLLLYPDRRVQHAGMFLASMPAARHAFRRAAADDPGYFGLARTERNVIAVTGACLMTRRDIFERLGGFDEAHDIINNDLDYCLRVWRAGHRTIYTPHARLIHHEAVSRADRADDFDAEAFDAKWRDVFLQGDPFFSPHLSKALDTLAPDDEPNRSVVVGRPALPRNEIKKILVVKLDHIGDCVMAFPAVRLLKRYFPESRITVLTSRAARPLWSLEPAVEAAIEFDFFHERSSEGQVELTEADWRALAERLAPDAFDLAVDLRKHLETRPVLQHTGARYLAGIDYRGKFPWLDIAVEWEGDPAYAPKRRHNSDDLIGLVDAIAAACATYPNLVAAPPADPSPAFGRAKAKLAGDRMLVCIHPTAGNDMKQWPIAYFAAVADRLVAEDGARIVLIGGPGDEEAGAEMRRRMRHPDDAVSLIAQVPLADLPHLFARCALFLGNDSGPKHIAAGTGVPTIAVHSGSVDVHEWGPVGPAAVAVVREVSCAPCYLVKPEDCRRGLACLRQLTPDAVYAACKRMLLASPPR